ncbi:MAG: sodium:proton antiporter [Paludibacteraceae bacterium]|nr:sodium:proton antiporter [Paludibacteraceae bacterium]
MEIPVWALIPFVVMLLCIAIGPLVAEHWWENNKNKLIVSLVLGVPTAIWLCLNGMSHDLMHQMIFDYIPFIILLTALFTVTGGIHLSGDIPAKPSVNTLFLGIGLILASIMGTTGAAMLLIRPLIETNKERKNKVHTILFFIAIVANCGGLLTPLGDPPLFLLYLKGAPFTWFLNLFVEWAFAGILLLVIYYFVDSYCYKQEKKEDLIKDFQRVKPLRLSGNINFLYLAAIVCAVAFINPGTIPAMGEEHAPIYMKLLREIVLIGIILASLFTTSKKVREDNKYSWGPIIEVAVLFLGIFATMTPALLFLKEAAPNLGLTESWQFYYCTGALSSFLDNAPTALAFHSVASGLPVVEGATLVAGIPEILLKAISIGAVFFGAMTYIGNGPNFMVKAIAEENKIEMPSFFGYMIKFSLIVLLPVYILTQLIFL